MKKILPLRTIGYNVPMSARSTRRVVADGESGQESTAGQLSVQIDFQSGHLTMEGGWQFIMSANNQAEQQWLRLYKDRVRFTATLFPGQAVDLADAPTGAAFAVEGLLTDGAATSEYTGLLLLDQAKVNKTPGTLCWNLNLYLYNSDADDCEIKLSWTFYPASEFSELN